MVRTRRAVTMMVMMMLAATTCGGAEPPAASTAVPSSTTLRPTPSSSLPTTSTTGARPLEGRVVVLDPGHNGQNFAHPEEIGRLVDIGNGTKACNTTGTETADGYTEARFTWEVATLTRLELEALGAMVVLTRQDNDGWGPCITERAAIGNAASADAVVSIHADGGPEDGRGYHVIHPKPVAGLTDDIAEPSLALARALLDAYAATGIPRSDYTAVDGLSARDDLGGLNLSDVPVVFLEAGNMRNPTDAALLVDPNFQDRIAASIVEALLVFLEGV